MVRKLSTGLLCVLALAAQSRAQQVDIIRSYPKAQALQVEKAVPVPVEKKAAAKPAVASAATVPKQTTVAAAPAKKSGEPAKKGPAVEVASKPSLPNNSTKVAATAAKTAPAKVAATNNSTPKQETAASTAPSITISTQPRTPAATTKVPAAAVPPKSAVASTSKPAKMEEKPAASSAVVAKTESPKPINKEPASSSKKPETQIAGTSKVASQAKEPAAAAPKPAEAKVASTTKPAAAKPMEAKVASATKPAVVKEVAPSAAKPTEPKVASTTKAAAKEPAPPVVQPTTTRVASVASASPLQPRQEQRASITDMAVPPRQVSNNYDTAFTKLADGFDFPIGKPDAQGYYKARGFRSRGHLGEDWDGVGGGDTDLGDSIYSIADGIVVFARDCRMGWGNVIIVRHSYREGGSVRTIDALYGHLNTMLVRRGQTVARGQKIATMGTAHGLYDAHLHLEIRKNIEIGMSRAAFAQDFSNYYDPTQFINTHRHLSNSGGSYRVAMNTFARDAHIKWDKARVYSKSRYRGGTSESAANLKKAIAAAKKN